MSDTTAQQVRAGLDHPVIDADGHWIEYFPVMQEAMRRIGGERAAEGFGLFGRAAGRVIAMSPAERRHYNEAQEAWWSFPAENTRDRATAMMPKLLHERLPELGLDFTVLYPSMGLGVPRIPDDATRVATCRAYNTFTADYFAPFADRMTPAAVIPMHAPDEACAELDHVVNELGMKVAMFASLVPRPVPELVERASDAVDKLAWLDLIGIDSAYDYDPVWEACRELGISPTFHSNGRGLGFGLRASVSNSTYNHIGHFAAAGEAVCKALFLGGVTRRFPDVRFGFLEGGVGWACQLLVDLVEHWEVRNSAVIERLNPARVDMAVLDDLAQRYGSEAMRDAVRRRSSIRSTPEVSQSGGGDDFARCEITTAADIGELFVDSFFFGCEADDKMNAWAFKSEHNAFGARLNAVFGSDIGHFDVSDMAGVLPEAHSLVDAELMTADDFRDFTFSNPAAFFCGANPDFFVGTTVEAAVSAISPGGPEPVGD